MSSSPLHPHDRRHPAALACTPRRRVRHEARDAAAVMVFSAAVSTGLAVLLTVVVRIGG